MKELFDSKKLFFASLSIVCLTVLMVTHTIAQNEGLEIFKWLAGLYLLGQATVDTVNGIKKKREKKGGENSAPAG